MTTFVFWPLLSTFISAGVWLGWRGTQQLLAWRHGQLTVRDLGRRMGGLGMGGFALTGLGVLLLSHNGVRFTFWPQLEPGE